ncbi:hypothetical protein ANCDUO_23750 [Ancylostoma duodenale]|uniref:Uncharacterized protein n=1 Tax=Ancylostoma duodenale TaxID=51022 RepID=A0A0C2BQY8_9BILA|nr:hypothetical protein ANCDUO_23750 [Ancylostoma duodenale]
MVSQAVLYAAHVLPVGMIWLACVTGFLPLMKLGPDCDCFRHLVLYAPVYAVLLLGVSGDFSSLFIHIFSLHN